jgi:hypothetical protein
MERYAKNGEDNWTQLQFTFDAVPVSREFPCGVKLTYRAYAAKTAIIIETSNESEVGYKATNIDVLDQPERGEYLLNTLPTKCTLVPEAFCVGASAKLDATVARIIQHPSTRSKRDVIAAWTNFKNTKAPTTDDAFEYVRGFPLESICMDKNFVDFDPLRDKYLSKSLDKSLNGCPDFLDKSQ